MQPSNKNNIKYNHGSRPVLLLIDFQTGFLKEGTGHLRRPVQRLVSDPLFSLVIATRFYNLEDSQWRTVLGWRGLVEKSEQRMAVQLPKDHVLIDKSTYGVHGARFDELISYTKNSPVLVAGVETDVCVTIMAAALFDAGVAPVILSEYTGTSRGGVDHQNHALLTLSRIVGRDNIVPNLEAWKASSTWG